MISFIVIISRRYGAGVPFHTRLLIIRFAILVVLLLILTIITVVIKWIWFVTSMSTPWVTVNNQFINCPIVRKSIMTTSTQKHSDRSHDILQLNVNVSDPTHGIIPHGILIISIIFFITRALLARRKVTDS